MQSDETLVRELNRLFSAFPPANTPDAKGNVRNYAFAAKDYCAEDVAAAIDAFIAGKAPGVNLNFVPTSAALGAECRRQLNLRLDQEDRRKARLSPPPDKVSTDEERTRAAAELKEYLRGSAERQHAADGEATRRRQDTIAKANARFAPSDDEQEFKKRLGLAGKGAVGTEIVREPRLTEPERRADLSKSDRHQVRRRLKPEVDA